MKLNDRWMRILKVVWLPIILILMIIAEPYLGIAKTPYEWVYLGIQIVLFIVYTYLLFKDRPASLPAEKKTKGKRKPKK